MKSRCEAISPWILHHCSSRFICSIARLISELWAAELRYAPDDAQLRFDLGTALLQQQRYAEATVQLRRLTELAPNAPEAHNVLGVALARQGQLAEAAVQFEETLALNPGHLSATRNLQWLRAQEQPQNLGR